MKMLYIPIISDIGKAFIALLMVLDSWVYEFISSSYRVFMALSGARLLSSDAFSTIANKLYIIVGVVMLFVLSYAIIKAIIDPDQMTKGDLGGPKLIKGVLIAVIGLGITPVLFNMLYQAQGVILENNVLGELFFRSGSYTVDLQDTTYVDKDGNEIKIEYNEDTINPDDILKSSGGALVATHIWQAFFYPASGNLEDAKNIESAAADYLNNNFGTAVTCGVVAGAATGIGLALAGFTGGISLLIAGAAAIAGASCYAASDALDEAYASVIENGKITLEQAYVMSASQGDFGIYTTFLDEVSGDDATIDYVMVLSTIVGGVVLYAFVSFSIDMGVRCAKLAYYQIIAPIPLILQVLPKFKDSFNKYVKGVLSTFLEVFIRISVVYVMVYIVCHITDLFSTSGVWSDLGPIEGLFARVLLDVGLVIFAKQAPKLIQETFGIQSGSMSLGIGKKLADGGALVAGAAIGGGLTAGVRNLTHRWGNKENWINKDKGKVTVGSAAKNLFGGVTSGVAGGASGLLRSGYGAKDAKNFKDMKNAAGTGAQAATDKRDQRETYAAEHVNKHGKSTMWSVGKGKLVDAKDKFTNWSGINSVTTYEQENAKIDAVASARKKMGDAALDAIKSNSDKRKDLSLGIDYNTTKYTGNAHLISKITDRSSLDPKYELDQYNTAVHHFYKNMIEEAKAHGGSWNGLTVTEWSDLLGDYEFNFKKNVEDVALMTDAQRKSLAGITDKDLVALKDTVEGSDAFKDILLQNVNSKFVQDANEKDNRSGVLITVDNIKNGTLTSTGKGGFDRLGDAMDMLHQENQKIITEARKKQDSKDKK